MKTRIKHRKGYTPPKEVEPDMAEVLNKMQQQLIFLEKKIDILLGKSPERPFGREHSSRPPQRYDHAERHGAGNRDNRFEERRYHKAICAECGKECEVPFRPTGDRPVYCKECFSKRKNAGPFMKTDDNRPREDRPVQEHHFYKKREDAHRGFDAKKKTKFHRRKST